MFAKKFSKEIISLLIIVGVLNGIASSKNWYWGVGEFDSMMHFLGGFWVAMTFVYVYYYSGYFNPRGKKFIGFLSIAFLGAILVSVSWEIFELLIGATFVSAENYRYDTTLDFIMDGLGALTACFYTFASEISDERKQIEFANYEKS